MRTAIYARKSTESEDRQVQSLDDQIRELKALARREGWHVAEIFQEARSAKAPGNRPEFARLVAGIESGRIEAILTWSVNRLSRNPVDGGQIAYLLQTDRLGMIRTPERTYRPDDNALLLSIENGMATAYVQDLRRNVLRGMRGKAERGWHACKPPIGYLNDAETREILPDSARFPLVRRGWDMLLSGGHRPAEIRRVLNEAGLTVRSRRRKHAPLSESQVYALFRNRFYAGEISFAGSSYPGRHVAMVTEEEFRQAQEVLDRKPARKKPESRSMAYSGTFACTTCGCAIVGEERRKVSATSGTKVTYRYYHCSGSKGCSKRSVREEDVTFAVLELVLKVALKAETAGWIADSLVESLERGGVDNAESVAALTRRGDDEDARLRRLALMRADGELDAATYADLRGEALDRQAAFREHAARGRDLARRVVDLVLGSLQACEAAGGVDAGRYDAAVLGNLARIAGGGVLNLFPLEFRPAPLISKIAAFEPLRDGSERPKRGDRLPLISVWWTLVEDLRKEATGWLESGDATVAEKLASKPYGRKREGGGR